MSVRLTGYALGLMACLLAGCGSCNEKEDEKPKPTAQAQPAKQAAAPKRVEPLRAPSHERPNIVVIVLDTARADHVSGLGYEVETTPHLDELMNESITFTRAHSTAPWTFPSHYSMFTGLGARDHGASWGNLEKVAGPNATPAQVVMQRLEPSDPSRMLAKRLKESGYFTMAFSGNPWAARDTAFATGFDEFRNTYTDREAVRAAYDRFPKEIKQTPEIDFGPTGAGVLMFKSVSRANLTKRPFFAFFNFANTHFPYSSTAAMRAKFKVDREITKWMAAPNRETDLCFGDIKADDAKLTAAYDAALGFMDQQVGRVLKFIKAQEDWDNTMVIVTSDHGEMLGEEGYYSHQLTMHEPVLHVPLIVKLPDGAQAGTRDDDPRVSPMDIYATVLAAAGVPLPSGGMPIDSYDLADMDRFARSELVAELDFSKVLLKVVKQNHPKVDSRVAPVLRRVIYGKDYRAAFVDKRLASVTLLDEAPDGGTSADASAHKARAEQAFAEYLAKAPERPFLSRRGMSISDTELMQLEALGYVQRDRPAEKRTQKAGLQTPPHKPAGTVGATAPKAKPALP